ncbi:MAG: GIY-YIG nuclease family protein [Cyclobacteriaceae bacterium]|nr:GIY-YIG nuclease family protein [Cyclobacteriaceae bacterium]
MIAKGGYIYIIANKDRNVLYIGVTSNLYSRIYDHKYLQGSKFASKYKCIDLLYYEFFDSIEEAIEREKKLKKWKRAWKEELIKSTNPQMNDLFDHIEDMQ